MTLNFCEQRELICSYTEAYYQYFAQIFHAAMDTDILKCAILLKMGMVFCHQNVNYVTTAHWIVTKIDTRHGGPSRHHLQALNRKSDEVTFKVKYTASGDLFEVKVKVKGQGHQRWVFSLATICT